MFRNFSGWELLVVLAIILLLFGSTRLPRLARSLRDAKDEFDKPSERKSKDSAAKEKDGSGTEANAG